MTKTHSTPQERYQYIASQHGGYWRHGFTDHNYLYNLYFPPEDFFTHITEHVHQLVLNYPIAQKDLAGLVGELICQPPERIVVGNGAAELIKIIAGLKRKLIVPVPSFNEYVNAAPAGSVTQFSLDPPSFPTGCGQVRQRGYTPAGATGNSGHAKQPDVTTGPEEISLSTWLKNWPTHDCMLIVDESFIDFARNGDQETLENEIEEVSESSDFQEHE